jgi:hypothetical protein
MDLIELDSNNGQGKFVRSAIRYIRITNLDDTNFIRVRFKNSGAETADVKVDAGATFMLSTGSMDADTAAGAFSAFVDIDNISAQADTATGLALLEQGIVKVTGTPAPSEVYTGGNQTYTVYGE